MDLGAIRERLTAAGGADLAAWERMRALLRDAVGESTFELWLERLELIAVDLEGALIVAAPADMVGWVARRFGRILDAAAQQAGRGMRVADEVERKAAEPLAAAAARAGPAGSSADTGPRRGVSSDGDAAEVQTGLSGVALPAGSQASRADQSAREPAYTSDFPSSYTDVYTQTREVS